MRCRTRFASFLLTTVVVITVRTAVAETTPEADLDPRSPVERELLPGETHSYGIVLRAGQFLRVREDQATVDVILAAFAPGGEPIAQVDNDEPGWDGGPERLTLIAATDGVYRLEVRAAPSTAASGRMRLSVEELRDAGPSDGQRVAAERAFSAGMALDDSKSYREAAPKLAEAGALYRACAERRGEAIAARELAGVLNSLGEFDEGVRLLQAARALFQAEGDRRSEGLVEMSRANQYQRVGEWERTLAHYEQARALFAAAEVPAGEAFLQQSIGSLYYRRLSDPQRGLEHFARALALSRQIGDRSLEASAHDWIGNVHRSLGNYESASQNFQQSLELSQALGSLGQEAMALRGLGRVQAQLGNGEQAIALLTQALELAQRSDGGNKGGTDSVLLVRRSFAEAYERLGQYDQALEQAQAAVARAGQDLILLNTARYYRARVERDRGNLVAAQREIDVVLESVESRRNRLGRDGARASLQELNHDYFELAIDVLMRRHRLAPAAGHAVAALQVAERMRARTLLDFLGEAGVDVEQEVDAELRARETAARRALDLAASRSPGRPARDEEITRLTEEYQDARAQIRRRSPRYAALTETQPLALPQIQQLLDARTVLLEYVLGAERSYLWVVSASELQVYDLAPRAAIEEAALDLWRRLSKRPGSDVDARALGASAARVAALVLAPAADSLRAATRWVVVADGALQAIPFGALPSPDSNAPRASGAPLVLEHEVVGLPSASVLSAIRGEVASRAPAPKAVAVLADPVFEPSDPRVRRRGLPGPRPAETLRARAFERALEDAALRSGHIPRLPFTRREADAAAGREPRSDALKALDFAANWSAATGGALAQYRVVHFASHGLLDALHPELSGIMLSLVDESGRPQPGFLGLTDVYGLKLPADLVVLSGCQTGLGRQVRGEGLLGLTRGFMYAGAARVVSSLWKVDDRATAELMGRFYQALRGKPALAPAAALRSAQASMAAEPRWREPYYWAGFMLQGEWR